MKTLFLNVRADIKVELDDQRAIVSLLRLELVDFIECARCRLVVDPAKNPVIEYAAIPTPEENSGVARLRKTAPEASEPMAVGRVAAIVADFVDRKPARIERRGKLSQRGLLPGSLRSFEQDDRPAAVRNLRHLKLVQMLA